MSLHPNEVLLAPVVSEKSYAQIEGSNTYSFRIHPDAHKTQVRQAVEELFDVKVLRVNVSKVQSKPKRRGSDQRAQAGLEEGDRAAAGPATRSRSSRGCTPDAGTPLQADFTGPPLHDRLDLRGDHEVEAREGADREADKKGGRNNNGPHHDAPSGRRPQASLPRDRLQAPKDGVPAKVAAIEYDPNRSARIALLHYADGAKSYILAPARLRVGATVESGPGSRHQAGQRASAREHPDRARSSTTSS